MLRGMWLVLCACSSPSRVSPPPPRAPASPPVAIAAPAVPAAAREKALTKIVVKASGAASRQNERPRVLAKLLADRGGRLELPTGYTRVGLSITEVISGTLEDPDYAKRPVGTNHLAVVLLDEAAFASTGGLDGFTGRWTLTRTADGTLTVSAIEDTPWAAGNQIAAKRAETIDTTRARLRSKSVADRLAGLEVFEHHAFYELVPDVIALLDDERQSQQGQRRRGPQSVSGTAFSVLFSISKAFGDDRMPMTGDRAAWTAFWAQLLAATPSTEKQLDGTPLPIASVPMNQSWPSLAAVPGGFVLAIDRMEQPFDGHSQGLALTMPPFSSRIWISNTSGEALDVARGTDGATAVLHITPDDRWKLALVSPQGTTKLVDLRIPMSHAALGATAKGYAIAYIKGDSDEHFQVAQLDAAGAVKSTTSVALPGAAQGGYHHGVFPLALAKRPGGWLVVVETSPGGTVMIALDDNFKQVGDPQAIVDPAMGIAQVKLAVGKERVLLTWVDEDRGRAAKLGYLVADLQGRVIGKPQTTGFDVDVVARPVSLDDDGFAIAWIAAEQEVHVGRWNAKGQVIDSTLVVPRGASQFTLSTFRDGKELVVGYQDVARYPFSLRARRVPL